MTKIRVLLVDDHRVVRQGIKLFLSAESDLEIIGEAGSGVEALQVLAKQGVDVILMDLLMPEMDGIQATHEVRTHYPDVETIALTSVLEDHLVHRAIEGGASGYLLKDTSASDLAEAIRAVHRGEVRLHPMAANRLATEVRTPEMRDSLTRRVNLFNVQRVRYSRAKIGYRVGEMHTGRGYATLAVELVTREAFETLGLHRLQAATSPKNIGSQIVLIRNRFEFFGRARGSFYVHDEWHDSLLFERTNHV